uniref:C2H2-type domain-containing protein n=1 Tax=Leptobrachium leishanense TaxID=445787 RepID=A0A8C5MUH4_9ANUR
MNKDKAMDPLTQKILDLTLEIIFLLTGEDQMVVKIQEMVTDNSHHQISEGEYCRTQSFNTEPPPHSGIHEQNNEKILELTNKIICLLTGEVPIRCEDVSVYLSMEEWEYLEEHKDLYEDIRTGDHQPNVDLGKSVSGESHTPVSFSDFGTEYIPSGGEKYLNKARKWRVDSVTSTEAEPLTFKERYFPEKDIYPNAEYTDIFLSLLRRNRTQVKKKISQTLTCINPQNIHRHNIPQNDREDKILYPDIYSSPEHTQTEYPSTDIKKESPTWKDGLVTYKEISTPPRQTPAECTPDKPEEYLKGNTNLMEINPSESLIESIKPNQSLYSTGLIYDSVYAGNSVPPSEMGNISTFDTDLVKIETNCREEPISSTASGEISTTESASKYQNVYTEEEQFSVPECEKQFTNTFALKKHQRIHKRDRPFKCPECGKCFDCSSGLARHEMVHSGEKPFKCLDCGKGFSQASNLAAHKMINTIEKPFNCTECGKWFSTSASLATHKMIHTGVKRFNCSECEKGFTVASHLAIHKRIHTGEKPFKCTECGNCFAWASSLRKHKLIHRRGNLNVLNLGNDAVGPQLLKHIK